MKYFMYILIVVLLIFGCADKPTGTSILGSIYGVVYDQDNNTELADVTVSINSVGNRTTNSNGFYEFKDLGEDTYTVFASKSGYATASEQIKVEPNRNKELNFNLHTIQPAQFLGTPLALNFANYYTNLEFTVNNGGDEELEWQVNSNQPWLTASPSTGITTTEADKVTVTVNRSDLEVGNYSGNLSFTSNGGNQIVPVTMEVSPVVLYVSPSTLNFGSSETSKSFTISNPGFGELIWSLGENQSWINVTPTSGSNTTNSSNVIVTIDRTGLNPNSYNGSISITSNGGNQDIAVSMQVEPSELDVTPSTLNFGSSETSKSFAISNPGFGELIWSLSSNQSWINVTPTSGSNTTNSSNVIVTIDREGLNPNSYNGLISITSNGGNQDIAVSMLVEEDTSIIEHFNNLNNWVNTTNSTVDSEAWTIDSNGYSGSCAKSVGQWTDSGWAIDKLSQTINVPTSATASIRIKKDPYPIRIYIKVDGDTVLEWGGMYVEINQWVQLQFNISAGVHNIEIEATYNGVAWIDELEIIGNKHR